MSGYRISSIANLLEARWLNKGDDDAIDHILYDTRAIVAPITSLFFAIKTAHSDGHSYLPDAYQKGVRNFIVDREMETLTLTDANILLVKNSVEALQHLAAWHRKQFQLPVIGITGSNGKTIVKEWLYQLLSEDEHIVRSPKSYNSQIGVPVSVWQISKEHTLGIFEAGISQAGEMEKLAAVIQPTIGVLTNLGEAHDEGFASKEEKLSEKLKLFHNAKMVIGNSDLLATIPAEKKFTWGKEGNANLQIDNIITAANQTTISGLYLDYPTQLVIPFTDEASIENAITCWTVMLYFEYNEQTINERFAKLHQVDMRLQLVKGINNCTIINDSYSADLTSLNIALHFLSQQKTAQQQTIILSDFIGSGLQEDVLYNAIAESLRKQGVNKVIGIGPNISKHLPGFLPGIDVKVYNDTDQFVQHFRASLFRDETILVKGARAYQFERIVQLLETKVHQTVLEINLNAIAHNLKEYRKLLSPGTAIMAMVKAFSYGSGGAEIASTLQFNKVDYLGVAYADEGVELRSAGISLPIMVMNTDVSSFNTVTEYHLEPVIYSFSMLQQFESYLEEQGLQEYPIHIEIETGMNRLGFASHDAGNLGKRIKDSGRVKAMSVFSHLASSENREHDAFTREQFRIFNDTIEELKQHISYPFARHISNSAAIIRHPDMKQDMVRLGIGLYGVELETEQLSLEPVASLKSTIAQLKRLKPGESVSYNRRGIVDRVSLVATVRIGYADGYSRRLGNGKGKMYIRGKLAPVIGNICMDMTMIDVTDIPGVKEGDEVVIFGKELPVQQLAEWAETIPYEILTSVSQRVKRVYFQE